jgi:hypothetical protein
MLAILFLLPFLPLCSQIGRSLQSIDFPSKDASLVVNYTAKRSDGKMGNFAQPINDQFSSLFRLLHFHSPLKLSLWQLSKIITPNYYSSSKLFADYKVI